MTIIKFNIDYKTHWGEELCIAGSIPQLGNLIQADALVLSTIDGNVWSADVQLKSIGKQPIEYYYFVRKNGYLVRREEKPSRMLLLRDNVEVVVKDHWKEQIFHTYLYSSVFTECVFKQIFQPLAAPKFAKSILLNVTCPFAKKDEHVVITGQGDALGNWELEKALPLIPIRHGEWQVELNANDFAGDVPYKFVIVNNADLSVIHWEDGKNRVLNVSNISEKSNVLQVESGLLFRYSFFNWKGKGVAIPLFSLKTENSSGVGEFLDLKKMIDWAAETNQNMIQILPINDTNSTGTWKDSYPYNSISIFALNPIYLSINEFSLDNKTKLKSYRSKAKKLNALTEIDYEQVFELKYAFLRDLFVEEGEAVMQSTEYINFYEKNREWLFPYICFCYLRDTFKTAHFKEWEAYSTYQPEVLRKLLRTNPHALNETNFYAYLQFLAHRQLIKMSEYAHEKGVALKGDIPIGINRNSVEAWTEPHLFNMQMQAGAPPDDFSANGQNWGFPTYNWDEMERNDFAWWKKRFNKMADYFDAYRIDHILGFFRIWEIPLSYTDGIMGHFSPALPFSKEELYERHFPFDEERMAKPYIHENMLPQFFGEFANDARTDYLDEHSWQRFQLKPVCDTQQKINQLFAGKDDHKSLTLRRGLYGLCTEVLFVKDPYQQNYFHPRISAQYTVSYAHLDDHVKEHYNHIYDDFFYRRHNQFWYDQAMAKLPQLISATSMMVCGEDLGMVPDCVNWVMSELRILSLEIQRMPKETNVLFSNLNQLPYLSVNTTSTHDMSPIRSWWEENRENTQYYYNNILGHWGDAPEECTPEICEQIVRLHLSSNSMWSVVPWQDWMSIDGTLRRDNPHEERINVPANSEHYWRYRMHISLENLLKETSFNERIKNMNR
ncbi:MAG: 4-alpha-glucanotransferase [Dysgonamonadaceae bacterium]|nr:4-alpha-glucanotransferase [Dysgonamonadaceae bacterium]